MRRRKRSSSSSGRCSSSIPFFGTGWQSGSTDFEARHSGLPKMGPAVKSAS